MNHTFPYLKIFPSKMPHSPTYRSILPAAFAFHWLEGTFDAIIKARKVTPCSKMKLPRPRTMRRFTKTRSTTSMQSACLHKEPSWRASSRGLCRNLQKPPSRTLPKSISRARRRSAGLASTGTARMPQGRTLLRRKSSSAMPPKVSASPKDGSASTSFSTHAPRNQASSSL